MKSAICRAKPRTRSCGCWSIRRSRLRRNHQSQRRRPHRSPRPARNLEEEISEGRFREDLYHRLSVVPIRVPPLSERREEHSRTDRLFHGSDFGRDRIAETPDRPGCDGGIAVALWPGNVRQLRNNVERVMILAGGGPEVIITADMLPQDVGSMVPAMPTSNNGEHIMGLPLREAREVFRARLSDRPDQPVLGQYLSYRGIRRHGAVSPASQAQGTWGRLSRSCRAYLCTYWRKPPPFWSFLGLTPVFRVAGTRTRLPKNCTCLLIVPSRARRGISGDAGDRETLQRELLTVQQKKKPTRLRDKNNGGRPRTKLTRHLPQSRSQDKTH